MIYSSDQLNRVFDTSDIDKLIENLVLAKENLNVWQKNINGKNRNIVTLDNTDEIILLKDSQKKLIKNILNIYPLSDNSFGYRKNRSYFDYLSVHKKSKHFLKLDIKDFFPSIKITNSKRIMDKLISINNEKDSENAITLLETIIFFHGSLPQGFITSPSFSNIYFTEADLRIEQYCYNNNIIYSRYSDDLIFSSTNNDVHQSKIITTLKFILEDYELKLNLNKTYKAYEMLVVNGFKIENEVTLSNKKMYKLTATLFDLERVYQSNNRINFEDIIFSNDSVNFVNQDQLLNYLSGMRAFLISSLRTNNLPWNEKCRMKIDRIENVIEKLCL